MEGELAAPGDQLLRRRPRRRLVAVVAVWALATSLGLGVAATTRIGPIVLTISVNHGVHLGDILACAVAYTAAFAITVRLS
jgi:hypothetical protein